MRINHINCRWFCYRTYCLVRNDASLYANVLNKYLQGNDFLNVDPYFPVKCLVMLWK